MNMNVYILAGNVLLATISGFSWLANNLFSPQPGPRGPEGAIGTASFFRPKKWPKKVSSRPSAKTVVCSYKHEWDGMCKYIKVDVRPFHFLK